MENKESKEVVVVEGKLRKIIHQEGEGEGPTKGQEVFALYRGALESGEEFDSNQNRDDPFKFVLGKGQVIKGWDQGFASMKKGEKATLICDPEYAYGARGSPPKIPPNAILHFEVELLDFKDKKKEKWEYSDEEKVAEGKRLKQEGNDKLKLGDFKGAITNYKEGIDFLQFEISADAKQLLNILRLNISQAYLKAHQWGEAVDHCSKVLKEQADNLKALYRRGVAYGKIQEFEKAQNDFNELLKHDANNAEAKKELTNVKLAIRQFKEKEKKVFGNIFAKGNLYDDIKNEPKIEPEVKKVDSQSDEQDEEKPQEKMEVEEKPVQKEAMQAEPVKPE